VLKKSPETYLSIDQSDRSLYSMLVDSLVGKILHGKLNQKSYKWFNPRVFASEPSGGILTQSWLVVIKILRKSNIETLRSNAEILNKSEEITESIAGHTLLWAIANYESVRLRNRRKL
jgi:hypothetical protein